jgi:hypothetical protein
MRVLDLEKMELDLEASDKVEARSFEPAERSLVKKARRERHWLAIREIEVAQEPGGFWRPRQNAKGARDRDHDHVPGTFEIPQSNPRACGEHREYGSVRGVLQQKAADDVAAMPQDSRQLVDYDRFASKKAVLIGKAEADDLDLALRSFLFQLGGTRSILIAPQPVTVDEIAVLSGAVTR